MPNTWRARFADLLEEAERPSRVRIVANLTLLMAIAVAVAAAMVETMNDVPLPVTLAAGRLSATASVLFTVEYILRLWVVPERAPAASVSARRARWVYARGFLGAVDLLVILPFWLEHFIPLGRDWFEIAGLLAILKLARYAPGLGLVARVFANEIRALSAAFIVLFVVLVLASGVMYTLESHAQPQAFSSIPATMWWGIVTMGTVGYGDMVPLTPLGRLFGSFIILLGVAVYAVPAGILATGFANEVRRRSFLVTWRIVSRVPIFTRLDASHIAEIARLLRLQVMPAYTIIVRRGDPADAMYFIMSGEVDVEVAPKPVRLKAGDHFGEVGLLSDSTRNATVIAASDCQLLALGVGEFRQLIDRHPEIRAHFERVAAERMMPGGIGSRPPAVN